MRLPTRMLHDALGALVIAVFVGGGASVSTGFEETELQCEEAYAHLESCCGDLHEAMSCRVSGGCSGSEPILEVSESRCIRKLSCDEIQDRGMCNEDTWRSDAGVPKCQ